MSTNVPQDGSTRRDFLGAAAAGAALATTLFPGGVHAAGDDEIKVGIIGCGGRGTGAGEDVLLSSPNVTIHALADAFQDRLDRCKKTLSEFSNKETSVNNRGDKPKEKRGLKTSQAERRERRIAKDRAKRPGKKKGGVTKQTGKPRGRR